jgi:hypothetical protein
MNNPPAQAVALGSAAAGNALFNLYDGAIYQRPLHRAVG